jgi:hypothetical protein
MRWAHGDEPKNSVQADLPVIKEALFAAYPDVQFSEIDMGWTVAAARGRRGVRLCRVYRLADEPTIVSVAEKSDIPDLLRLLA